jgi:radical SAM protein with 4Fe4S-binding SPASM domain
MMLLNIIMGGLIFSYAGWQLFRFARKSREGKCAACSMKDHCSSPCHSKDIES